MFGGQFGGLATCEGRPFWPGSFVFASILFSSKAVGDSWP